MIALHVDDKLYGKTDGGNVVYTLFGTDANGSAPRILAQGFFASCSELFRAPVPVKIHSIHMASVTPGYTPALVIYAGGTSLVNTLFECTIPDGGSLSYGDGRWTTYASSGTPSGGSSSPGPGGVSDGDYGDIAISGGGTVFTVKPGLPADRVGNGDVTDSELSNISNTTSDVQVQVNARATLQDVIVRTFLKT